MKFLYKYPHRAFPYRELVEENQRRAGSGPEYELLETGIFDESRYFDIIIEYAKNAPEDIAIRITVTNHGPDAAPPRLPAALVPEHLVVVGDAQGATADRPGPGHRAADGAPRR